MQVIPHPDLKYRSYAAKLEFFKDLLRRNNIELENFTDVGAVSGIIAESHAISNHNKICKAHDPAANRRKTNQVRDIFRTVENLEDIFHNHLAKSPLKSQSDDQKLDYIRTELARQGIFVRGVSSLDDVWAIFGEGSKGVDRHGVLCDIASPELSQNRTKDTARALYRYRGLFMAQDSETLQIDNRVGHIPHNPSFYNDTGASETTAQSFDQIIMECQDMLSVETEVKKAYEKWLGNEKVKTKYRPYLEISCLEHFRSELKRGILYIPCGIILGGISAGVWSLYSVIPGGIAVLLLIFGLVEMWYHWGEFKIGIRKTKSGNSQQPTEHNKFQFLKESYVGTIQKLDNRLNLVKSKINAQIEAHTQDKEQVLQYQDMFDETDSVIHKIERAISSLRESHDKVSEKKAELHKTLNDYIGENGYISQKEKELERIKVAQELSDRMQANFGKTLEIVKNVDVLADVIIPGIKQLMEFKIPELIENVEFECDKERVMLGIK